MHAQRSADARGAHELVHELWFLLLELGELVGDDEQVRDGVSQHAAQVVRDVLVDVHGGLARDLARAVEGVLPALELALDGHEATRDGGAIEVGDGARQVRQAEAVVVERAGESASLVVDEHEGHLVGRVAHSQAQHVGDDELALARARGPRDEPMRSMDLLVQVEHGGLALGVHAHRRLQRSGGVGAGPAGGDIQLRNITCLEHLQEAEGRGQGRALPGHVQAHAGHAPREGVGVLRRDLDARGERQHGAGHIGAVEHARAGRRLTGGGTGRDRARQVDDVGALARQVLELLAHEHEGDTAIPAQARQPRDRLRRVGQGLVRAKHHIARARVDRLLAALGGSPLELALQVHGEPHELLRRGRQETPPAGVVKQMGQRAHAIPLSLLRLIRNQHELHVLIAHKRAQLDNEAAGERPCLRPRSHNACDVVLGGVKRQRNPDKLGRAVRHLNHLRQQTVPIDRELFGRPADICLKGKTARSHTQIHKVAVRTRAIHQVRGERGGLIQ